MPGQSGFALLEVIVAITLLVVTLVAVMSTLGVQSQSVRSSTNEQVAAGLLDEAIEQIRALPYSIVANGMSNSDATVTSDSQISITGTSPNQTWTYVPTGEVIPHSTLSYTQAPLVPHLATTTINNVTYTVAAYPTQVTACSCSGVYRVSIVVSWSGNTIQGGLKRLSGETFVYSASSGCLTDTNHPFSAPCQPFLYAGGLAGKGAITVTGSGSQPVSGVTFSEMELTLAKSDSTAQIEQTSTVLSSSSTSGAAIDGCGSGSTSNGAAASTSVADNDPGTSVPTSETGSESQASGTGALTCSGGANSVSASPGSTDSGASVATGSAASSPACDDLGGTAQVTGLPCGSSSASQTGSSGSLTMALSGLGTTMFASVGAQPSGESNESFAARYSSSGGTYCSSTSGDGCVHVGAQMALGTVTLAGLPSQFITDGAAPSGWGGSSSNYLVSLSNFSAQASSESGISSASPTVAVPISGKTTPTLTYWNGSGYTTKSLNWGATAPTITIPTVTVTDSHNLLSPTVTISATLTLGAWTTSTSSNAGCATPCTGAATVTSPVQGEIDYTVTELGVTVANLTVSVNLGELELSTSYEEAP